MPVKSVIMLFLLTVACVLPAGCLTNSKQTSAKESTPIILEVDDIAADPSAYSGAIAVRGIVSFADLANSTFGIIDVREYKLCGVVTCAANEIPISVPLTKYSGELPGVEDEVLVYGETFSSGGSYSIEVSKVTIDDKVILNRIKE